MKEASPSSHGVRIIPRSEHSISRDHISENALKVLYRLKKAGYESYLVGGAVRDLLLGRLPKDFDIATNATPEEIHQLFRNCRLIGRRFRLAHVHFRGEIIEVATFRGSTDGEDDDQHHIEEGRILRDNVFGSLDEDAWRRDFTVNALYYDIKNFSVVDHVNGMVDIQAGLLRLIGDPMTRYHEDPVRMLRAVRFAVKLGFRIHEDSEKPVFELAHLLAGIPPARLYEEVLKLFQSGLALQTFEMLRHYGLFRYLFPATDNILDHDDFEMAAELITHGLRNTDKRVEEGKPITPAFLFAVLLWPAVSEARQQLLQQEDMTQLQAYLVTGSEITSQQVQQISIPKRFSIPMREIWSMQERLTRTWGKRPLRLLQHQRFRAAYDFLLLREKSGEDVAELAAWWTTFQEVSDAERNAMVRTRQRGHDKSGDKSGGKSRNKSGSKSGHESGHESSEN
ncbi:MAG: polynucleotide adenylyltransferase PcnB [Gammaproteobacteria bacterium]|nr:MAG: polynucleotide adenylyltransferase PcnB [Gammaproteobacteria bacterium]